MNDLEVFVITNGRSTFDSVIRSLKEQSNPIKVTVVRDMVWVDALNECVKLCESEFFIRVDDDMFLHKFAVDYYRSKIPKLKNKCGIYVCRLWEEWSSKPINGLRMYRTSLARKITFKPSKLGKVDKIYRKTMSKMGYEEFRDKAIVGVHALSSEADQLKYRDLWRDKNSQLSQSEFKKTFDNKIHRVNISIENQYFLLTKMRKINSKHKTKYDKFITERRRHG